MPLRSFHNPGAGLEYRLTVALALAGLALLGVLILRLVLPWLVGVGVLGCGLWLWRRRKARQRELHQLFYAQITAYQGRISVLDFAIAAQITGSEARQFLDQRAQEFWGDFEPTPAGDVLYTFRSGQAEPAQSAAEVVPGAISLTAADLAQRLGCIEADLRLYQSSLTFMDWSRDRDPDSCGWRYDAERDRYWPVL